MGTIALVLTACGTDTRPRTRADESVLIEITGAHTAKVTVQANQWSFFSQSIEPRGGPSTTTTSSHPLTDQEQADVILTFGQDRVTGISRPRATLVAVGDLIAHDTVVTKLENLPERLTATLHFARIAPTVRVRPAAVVRAVDRGSAEPVGAIWVGVCIKPTQGRWATTSDTFDRSRGCAGWVPDPHAVSVGVLHSESSTASETWMIGLLGLGAVLVLVAAVVRARVRPLARIRWLWAVPAAVFVAALAIEFMLVGTVISIGRLQDIFGASLEDPTRKLASNIAWFGLATAVAAFFTWVWTFSQPPAMDRDR